MDINTLAGNIQNELASIRAKTEEGLQDVVRTDELKRQTDALVEQIKGLQDSIAAQNTLRSVVESVDTDVAEKQAFAHYVSKGAEGVVRDGNDYRVKALGDAGTLNNITLNAGVDGGILLPKVFGPMVDGILRRSSPLRGMATVRRGGLGYSTPFKTAKGSAGIRSEFGATTQSSTTQFNAVNHSFYEVNEKQLASVWALQGDVKDFDILSILIADVIEGLGEKDARELLLGTTDNTLVNGGTVKSGLLSQTKLVSGVDRFTNVIGSQAGVETATAGAITPDDFINALFSLHGSYHANAKFMTSLSVLKNILTIKDDNHRYLLEIGNVQDGWKPSILGKEIVTSDYFPEWDGATETTVPHVLVGDFKNAVVISDATDIAWQVNPYTDDRYVSYLARFRTSAANVNPNALRGIFKKHA